MLTSTACSLPTFPVYGNSRPKSEFYCRIIVRYMIFYARYFALIRDNSHKCLYPSFLYINRSIPPADKRRRASACCALFFALRRYHKMHFRLCGMKGRPERGIRFYGTAQPFRHICPNHSFGEWPSAHGHKKSPRSIQGLGALRISGVPAMAAPILCDKNCLSPIFAIERAVLHSFGEEIGRACVGKECLRLCRSRWSPYH